jgi:two-component system CheB/CheR fusion protein
VPGDAVRLSQSVGNLLGNAIKFSTPGGRVWIRVEPEQGDAAVAIRVGDTGIGMDGETLAHAFEPFAQAPGHAGRGGLGLGLPLVRAMVALHGGTVEARSDGPGRGSELTIRLPMLPEDAAAKAAEQPGARRRRVLVIEDNEDAAETTQMLLEMFGHEVTIARSGGEGITEALARPPDVILCDLTLSGDVDGYGVARALRANPATTATYLVAVTGHGMEEDQRRTRDAGFDLHLTKPVDPGRLQQVVASAQPRA